jgi:hypothetical protein
MLRVRVVHEVEVFKLQGSELSASGLAFIKDDTEDLTPLVNGDTSEPVST